MMVFFLDNFSFIIIVHHIDFEIKWIGKDKHQPHTLLNIMSQSKEKFHSNNKNDMQSRYEQTN